MFPIKDFNVNVFIQAAEELLRSDETSRALDLLDNLPAYYRQNPPQEILNLKHEIMSRIATPSFYATHEGFELTVSDEDCLKYNNSLRSMLVKQDVSVLNKNGFHPHIIDLGPGELWLPLILKTEGLKFTYEPVYVNHPTFKEHAHRAGSHLQKGSSKDEPTMFVATEILEHLWQPKDIRFEMQQHCGLADIVHISTPLMTFDPNCMDWRSKDWLGHLFAFTNSEFRTIILNLFPEYEPAVYESQVQHARLINPKTKFDCIKIHYDIKT